MESTYARSNRENSTVEDKLALVVRARSPHERDSEQNMTESCWNAGIAVDGVGVLVNSAPHSTTPLTSEIVRGIALHRAGITIMHSPPAKTTPSRVPLSPIASEVSHK